MLCLAETNFGPYEWQILRFYRAVQDQILNIGSGMGEPWLVPRLEAWEVVGRLMKVSADDLPDLIEHGRYLHALIHSDYREVGVQQLLLCELEIPALLEE